MKEKSSWASTYVTDSRGFKITLCQMGESAEAALNTLFELVDGIGATPFLDRNNVMLLEDKTPAGEPSDKVKEDAFPQEAGYHGMQPQKLENIFEGDSYDVVASTYSYDGTWVNFYNGGDSLAGHYYATNVGAKIFNEMFGWQPVEGADKAVLPGGTKVLGILGVKGKKTEDIYQNIKTVSDG